MIAADEGAVSSLVVGISPFERPDPRLVSAVCRAGGLGVLDLGSDERSAAEALRLLSEWAPAGFGVRVGADCPLDRAEVMRLSGGRVDVVVLAGGASATGWPDSVRILAEVTNQDQARGARRAGAHGLIARGREAGGPVGELSTFVLLQQLLADPHVGLPIWAAGGIGAHTSVAAVIGGAAGVVLDSALALLDESDLPADLATAIRRMDGSESAVTDGRRAVRSHDGSVTVAVGEDAFLAGRFASAYGSVGTAVRAVRDAILAGVEPDAAGRPVELGCALPIVQGPMTRVSDQPGFAATVAAAGGLPFLALALSSAEQTRAMLEQTQAAIGAHPWGVGVLGFAPEDVRSAQLEVIRQVRPTHAIIAGGRPAQAHDLEQAGISTFLHVPSPGLLGQFLAAGSRKFVFEGSECGGHVGPRASFPLWEAQLGVITDYLDAHGPTELQLLFAGGVHDARSAAMVGALTAPLAERGVSAGVLMGTAYLFTAEAVELGAVLPTFQREVLAAEATALLETAPGHATRGIASPFTDDFAAAKAELGAAGLPQREIWERLEELNIGRLRIASKGLRRDGDQLLAVDDQTQRAEGLFMAGQVAVLRNKVTTVAELHADVTEHAATMRQERAAALRADLLAAARPVKPAPLDIAIVGMDCVFPNSPDLASFWATIVDGIDAVTEVPPQRWDAGTYYDPAATGRTAGQKTPSRWGGFLPPIAFDPLRYGIPPSALGSIDPTQLLALEVARRALVDAGYDRPGVDHARTSVIFGAEAGSDLSNAGVLRNLLPAYLGELPPELDEQLPTLTEDSFPGVLANVISGRIANRLDLGGANYTVDAACASGLAAVDLACRQLRDGSSDVVLCGAADLHNGINDYLMFSSAHALSPTGRSRTFGAEADGIALGEGVACVVLKRLADAERDGDRIYAVIAGVGGGSDGKALGLTAPRPEGQRRAMDRAYAGAGISPDQVGLVEAHGTGTLVGDRTELATLTALFTEHSAPVGGCALGSVKSQIGHTKCAAGLAGLIKASMAIHTGVRPPTLGLTRPNPGWDADSSPFSFTTAARPWSSAVGDRIAGVSAFGFGGTNFHVVLRGYDAGPDLRHGRDQWPAELFTFRGPDQTAARREADWLLGLIAGNDAAGRPWRLRDLAATAARRAESRRAPVRIALVARDLDDLASLVSRASVGEHDPAHGLHQPTADATPSGGKVALLFPGQGSQRPGMLAELFVAFPELQRYLRLAGEHAATVFPPSAFDDAARAAHDDAIRDTRRAQPALGLGGLAVDHLLRRLLIRADMLAGHSYGELVALASAGVFDPATLLQLSTVRAEAILSAAGEDPGSMAAVSAPSAEIETVLASAGLAGRVVPANQNAPRQTVISGPTDDVTRAVEALRAAGLGAKRLAVACAFHSPVVAAGAESFGAALDRVTLHAPRVPVWANRTAAPYGDVRDELTGQVGSPVRFVEQIEAMYAAGARIFVEAGPGQVLTRLVAAILGERAHVAVAVEPRAGSGLRGLLDAVATLAVSGVELSTSWLFAGRDALDVAGLTPPKRPGWTVDGQLVRTVDGEPVAGGLVPARRINLVNAAHSNVGTTSMNDAHSSDQHALLAEYLRTSRELIAAQRDVMLGFLAASGVSPTVQWQPVQSPVMPALAAPTQAATAAPALEPVAALGRDAVEVAAPDNVGVDVQRTVLDIISERTGYPIDMIEPDLDLEADLSIDSIKRTEIAGELALRLGLGAAALGDAELEELAKARTTRAIVAWLDGKLVPAHTEQASAPPARVDAVEPAAGPEGVRIPGAASDPVRGVAPKRLLLTEVPLPAADPTDLAGQRVVLLGAAGPSADTVATQLAAAGAEVLRDLSGPAVDGVLWLAGGADAGDDEVLPEGSALLKDALSRSVRWLVAVSGRTAGLRGAFRSLQREYPDVLIRLVEVADGPPDDVAAVLAAELAHRGHAVVLRAGSARLSLEPVEVPLGVLGSSGAGPAGDGTAEAQALGLGPDSVVVLVGGARGITAGVAVSLAAACRCRIALLGRTPLPTAPEATVTRDAVDAAALRSALIASGLRAPSQIEDQVGRILAGREVAATLGRIADLGSEVSYTAVDVRDDEAVHRVLKQIHSEYGRIDGVVYAAGVIEDKLLAEKDLDSFRRVYSTKVDGAAAVLAALSDLPEQPGFVALFGSIAAVFGNRGQVDYAAANDAMQLLGARWSAASGTRCLTVHWGPWAPSLAHGGMVTPELGHAYEKRGISLIDPAEGVLSLLRELAWGDPALTEVVYTASGW